VGVEDFNSILVYVVVRRLGFDFGVGFNVGG